MISPWLVDVLYQMAQLLCVYTPSNLHPETLLQLYTCIESGRKEYNASHKLIEQYDEEWDLIKTTEGYSLFYVDTQTRQILIEGNDADDLLRIGIGNEENAIFCATLVGNDTAYRHCFNERLLTNDTHIALLQFLDTDILNGQFFGEDAKIQKLPSYALH